MKHLTFVPARKLLLPLAALVLGAAPALAETFVSGDVYGKWTDVDASNCYWGHPSGPYDPTDGNPDYNPGGLGQGVSDYVIYRPWLASPAETKFHVGYPSPNPALTTSSLRLSILAPQRVKVDVLDIRGRLTRRLVDEVLPTGTRGVTWDGRNEAGRKVASGIYFLRVSAPSGTRVRRVVLLR